MYPHAPELRAIWPTIGPTWIRSWCDGLTRDLTITGREIAKSDAAAEPTDAREPLETALWRLDSAREKIHAIIALTFGIPSLRFKDGQKRVPRFRVKTDETRAKLRELATTYPAASALLSHDTTVNSKLGLRHDLAHSLASIAEYESMTWFERGVVTEGGVTRYVPNHLTTGSHGPLTDVSAEAIRSNARKIAAAGFTSLTGAVTALAALLTEVGTLEPPEVFFSVTETGGLYANREKACEISREAAGLPPLPPMFGDTSGDTPPAA